MAILRVSDLQVHHTSDREDILSTVEDAYYGGSTLPKSLMEISWNTNPKYYTNEKIRRTNNTGTDQEYRSDAITIDALSTVFIHPIKNMDFDFYNTKTFHDDVYMNNMSVSINNVDFDEHPCGPILSSPNFIGHPETVTPFNSDISRYDESASKDGIYQPGYYDLKQVANVEYVKDYINYIWSKTWNEEYGKFWQIMRDTVYPIDSIYMTTQQVYDEEHVKRCPLDDRVNGHFGYWELVSQGEYILGSGNLTQSEKYDAGQEITNIGLPDPTYGIKTKVNFTGKIDGYTIGYPCYEFNFGGNGWYTGDAVTDGTRHFLPYKDSYFTVKCDADIVRYDSNSIYGKSDTIRPRSYVVDVWKRVNPPV